MIKLFGVVGFVVVLIYWQVRQAQGRRRVREIEHGKRCMACNGMQTQTENWNVRCLQCGFLVSFAVLQKSAVRDDELAAVTRPDEKMD
ncbi:hypothetical protein [Chondromyces crocatus]|uniref:Uncharacterized protein n=1 Tax=Chondromyces crocatus TaxID=52 RepID=A0A0K1EPI5_CHOCO|nr:hypothetical protein [Chondromyces crocatus]AKT42766.1 uncharacterized protein CMC5_069930 [Chondromyces crocatus]